ncbi:hypothetical protein [Bradyrhizobium cosmicum]|uniref:hypothetical protein n=1 Tax=Bradyrhizobium cosmicum TaxID=1404864 RepID=UPI0028EBFADE|nr:hypothetical protein [Bradyrhizobium cosmicum]
MDGNCAAAEAAVLRPVGDVLCGTLFLLPGATALTLGEGAPKGKASSYASG